VSATDRTCAVGQYHILQGQKMRNEIENRQLQPEGNDKWGLVFLLALVLGIPILGILVKYFGY
jgi:hypothetical protein